DGAMSTAHVRRPDSGAWCGSRWQAKPALRRAAALPARHKLPASPDLLLPAFSHIVLLGDFFFSSTSRHTSCYRDWSSDVCSSDLVEQAVAEAADREPAQPRGKEGEQDDAYIEHRHRQADLEAGADGAVERAVMLEGAHQGQR